MVITIIWNLVSKRKFHIYLSLMCLLGYCELAVKYNIELQTEVL